MNRSRLLSYVAAAVVALPTAYAFAHYAQEASELRRLAQVSRVAEAKPAPSATEEKPRPEAQVAKAGESKPTPEAAAPAGEAKPEAEATAKAGEKKPDEKRSDEKKSDEKKSDEKKSEDEVKLARAESKGSGEGSSEEGSSKKKRRKKDSGDEGASSSDEKKDSGDKVSASAGSGEGSSEEGSSKKKRDGEDASGDTGQLNLKADQTAEVYVDGRRIGVTPVLGHKVSIGRHRVRFDCLTPDGKKRGSDQRVKVPPLGEVLVEHKCAAAE